MELFFLISEDIKDLLFQIELKRNSQWKALREGDQICYNRLAEDIEDIIREIKCLEKRYPEREVLV